MKNILKLSAILGVFISLLTAAPAAHADLTLLPTRIVFEEGERFDEVIIINSGDVVNTYEIGWQFYKMIQGQEPPYQKMEGSITDFDLSRHIVYTPRRVTLAPGGRQKVKLALRRPPEVAPGEYRAHLAVRTLPADEGDAQVVEPTGEGLSAAVEINVAFSIPVIFRAGEPTETAQISNVRLERNPNSGGLQAVVSVNRAGGPYGVLGHLFVYDGSGDVIGEISNAYIFPEVTSRTFTVQLTEENLSGQNIRFVLNHHDLDSGKIYAEQTLPAR
ncbi:MAG: hypothetical protein AAF204_02990 [Pseudomonadota bacterium]